MTIQFPAAGVDPALWFTNAPITVKPEDIYPQPDFFQQYIDQQNRAAVDKINREMDAVIAQGFYGGGIMSPEEVSQALGLDKALDGPPMVIGGGGGGGPVAGDFSFTYPEPVPMRPKPRPEPELLDFTVYSYMGPVHNPDLLLEIATENLKGVECDTLVGTGLSGTIAVSDLARKFNKHYLVVRKPNDGSHSCEPVEGRLGKKWVFVDDLVSTGRTFSRVFDVVEGLCKDRKFTTEYVGALLYADREFMYPTNSRTHYLLKNKSKHYRGQYAPSSRI